MSLYLLDVDDRDEEIILVYYIYLWLNILSRTLQMRTHADLF